MSRRSKSLDAASGGERREAAVSGPAPRARSSPLVALSVVAEYLLPGAGYLLLGRPGRAVIALVGMAALVGWGLHLDGQLDRPEPNQILSYLASFACAGLGAAYFVVTGSDALGRGLGNVTSATHEYGTTFLRAAGLIGFLLVLDVYDVAVGRKG